MWLKSRLWVKIGKRRWTIDFRGGEVKWSMSAAVFNTWDYGPFVCSEHTQSLSPCKTLSNCHRHPDQAHRGRVVHCCNQLAISKSRINWEDKEPRNREEKAWTGNEWKDKHTGGKQRKVLYLEKQGLERIWGALLWNIKIGARCEDAPWRRESGL